MGLDGLAAAESRIAQIQSMFTSTNVGSTLGSSPQARTGAAIAAGTTASGSSFQDLLNQYGGTASSINGTAAQPLLPQTNAAGNNRGAQYTQFAQDVLQGIGAPVTSENVRALQAWSLAEGTSASNNPLATTRTHDNTTNFNSVGVKNYASYGDGVQATVETLLNGRYPNILAAFADGTSATNVAHAVAASPWGTGHGVERVLATGGV